MSYVEPKLVTYEKSNCDVQNCILNTFIRPHHFTYASSSVHSSIWIHEVTSVQIRYALKWLLYILPTLTLYNLSILSRVYLCSAWFLASAVTISQKRI